MLHSYLISVSFLVQFFILMCPLTFSDQDEVKYKSALDSQTTRCISSVSSFSLGPTSLRSFFPRPIEIFTVCLCLTCWLPAYLSFHCHYLLSSPLITHLSCPCLFVCLSLYLALPVFISLPPSTVLSCRIRRILSSYAYLYFYGTWSGLVLPSSSVSCSGSSMSPGLRPKPRS